MSSSPRWVWAATMLPVATWAATLNAHSAAMAVSSSGRVKRGRGSRQRVADHSPIVPPTTRAGTKSLV